MSRILVVDDQEDIRLLLRIELSADGHQITEAADGEQALAAIEAHRPDLVLLDIMMPVLDGWEVLRRLDASTSPPVVVVTGMASSEGRHVAELLELGALDVVRKPFDPGWLLELVEAVLLVDPDEREEYRRRRLSHAQQES
jgi:DNA-binding response OmpR family regulator